MPNPKQAQENSLHGQRHLLHGRFLSIRARVTWTLIVFFSTLLPVVVLSTYYSSGMFSVIQQIVSVDARLATVGENISQHMLQARRAEKNFLLFGDPSYLEEIAQNVSQIDSLVSEGKSLSQADQPRLDIIAGLTAQYRLALDTLVILTEGERRKDPYAQIRQNFTEHRQTFDQMIRDALSTKNKTKRDSLLSEAMNYLGSFEEALMEQTSSKSPDKTRLLTDLKQVSSAVDTLASRIATEARADMENQRKRGSELGTRGQRDTLTALMVTIILAICLLILLPTRIVRPITRLTNVIHWAEDGDLHVRLESLPNDEVGELALHLNRLLSRARTFDQLKVQKIIEVENRFRTLSQYMDRGVAVADLECRVVMANKAFAQLAGSSPEETVGKQLSDIQNFQVLEEPLRKMVSGKSRAVDVEMTIGEATRTNHRAHLELIRDGSGKATSVLLIVE